MFTDLQIATWEHCFSGGVVCGLCGQDFDADCVSAALVYGSGETLPGERLPNGAVKLDICPDCLAAGPAGTSARIRARAAELREQCAELETLAFQVGDIHPENWLTRAELDAAQKQLERAGG